MADLYMDAPDPYTVRWQAYGISAWNSSNYQKIVLSIGTTTNGSYNEPDDIVDTVWPSPTGSNTFTPLESLNASPDTYYYRYCYALDRANSRWWYVGEKGIWTPEAPNQGDTTDPTLGFAAPSGSHVTQTSIYAYATGADNEGLDYFRFLLIRNGQTLENVSVDAYGTWDNADHTFTGLSPGTTYRVEVRVVDTSGNWTSKYHNVTTKERTVPDKWYWDTTKSSGGVFDLGATEWKNFFNRINDFRSYKGWGSYSYSLPEPGGIFWATMYNEARNAINTMNPPTSIPQYRGSGEIVYASELNALRDALNSIT